MKTARTLTFDDIDTTGKHPIEGLAYVPPHYNGLTFRYDNEVNAIDPARFRDGIYAGTGVAHGVTSGTQEVIFSRAMTVIGDDRFTLKSVNITSGDYASDTVEVVGYGKQGEVLYDTYVDVASDAPTKAVLNFKGVSSVMFKDTSGSGNVIAIDDMKVRVAPPSPSDAVGTHHDPFASSGAALHPDHLLFGGHEPGLF